MEISPFSGNPCFFPTSYFPSGCSFGWEIFAVKRNISVCRGHVAMCSRKIPISTDPLGYPVLSGVSEYSSSKVKKKHRCPLKQRPLEMSWLCPFLPICHIFCQIHYTQKASSIRNYKFLAKIQHKYPCIHDNSNWTREVYENVEFSPFLGNPCFFSTSYFQSECSLSEKYLQGKNISV